LKIINGFHLKNLRGDILGGITAAVVALPLALAFGNAALGPGGAIYGLYGAVVVGFLAALFGGTPAQVSGPTGPMSVTVAGVVAGLAAVGVPRDLSAGQILPLVMAAVVIGGLLQILFGILKLGKYIMDHISICRFFSVPKTENSRKPLDNPPDLSGAGSFFIPFGSNLPKIDGLNFHRGYGIWGQLID